MKYSVESRRIVSKMLGIFGSPVILGFLAVNTIIENARTSGGASNVRYIRVPEGQ